MVDRFFPSTAMPDRGWWAVLWPSPENVLRLIGAESGMTAVDLCCGDGYFTLPLARITGGQVYGVDIDAELLEQARHDLETAGVSVLDLIHGDARDLATLLPAMVDFVLIANTFHGVPEQTRMSNAVASVLQPGGQFAIINWHPRPREETVVLDQPRGPPTDQRMTPGDLRRVVEPAGLVLNRMVDLPPYHYGAVFDLASDG